MENQQVIEMSPTQRAFVSMKSGVRIWVEVSAEQAMYALEAVPPKRMRCDGHICGEPYCFAQDMAIAFYSIWIEYNGQWYTTIGSVEEFDKYLIAPGKEFPILLPAIY